VCRHRGVHCQQRATAADALHALTMPVVQGGRASAHRCVCQPALARKVRLPACVGTQGASASLRWHARCSAYAPTHRAGHASHGLKEEAPDGREKKGHGNIPTSALAGPRLCSHRAAQPCTVHAPASCWHGTTTVCVLLRPHAAHSLGGCSYLPAARHHLLLSQSSSSTSASCAPAASACSCWAAAASAAASPAASIAAARCATAAPPPISCPTIPSPTSM